MSNATGVTRGDRRRNARRERLRVLVPTTSAIVGIDLGEDTQMIVVTDHDSRVLARRQVTAKAAGLGPWLDWAAGHAVDAGFTSITVACEPTGSRWMHLQDLTAARGLANVCVQPLATHRAREEEDYTRDKSDLLTELWRGVQGSARRGALGASTVCGRDRRRGRRPGSFPVGGCGAWVAGAYGGSVRAVPAG